MIILVFCKMPLLTYLITLTCPESIGCLYLFEKYPFPYPILRDHSLESYQFFGLEDHLVPTPPRDMSH